jgi:hypothetical protein
MTELYTRFDYLVSFEGPFAEELPSLLSGGVMVNGGDRFQLPKAEPLIYWQGHLALIGPREGGRVVVFDGLAHLNRAKTGLYIETGEITRAEIEQMRVGEGCRDKN